MTLHLFADPGSTAVFDGSYRYLLTRATGSGRGTALFVMLNPSTATAFDDDATIAVCTGFARRWGYARLAVVNLFAWMSTDPRGLRSASDPVGPRNDGFLDAELDTASLVVAAWGVVPRPGKGATPFHPLRCREREVVERITASIADTHHDLHCLAQNADGSPHHPLYLSTSVTPVLYRAKVPR
jgi:hypothetical protein